jgi:hypothetical protein
MPGFPTIGETIVERAINFAVFNLPTQSGELKLSWQQVWPISSSQSSGGLYQPSSYQDQAVGKKYQSHVGGFDFTNYGDPFAGLFLLICGFCTVLLLLFIGLGRCERGKNGAALIFFAVLLAIASCTVCALWPMLTDKIGNRRM